MKKYMIEEVKSGVTVSCGPVGGNGVVSVKVFDGMKSEWWTIEEVEGIPAAFITEKDVFNEIIEDRFDEAFINYLNEHAVNEFTGIELEDDFNDFFRSFQEKPENPAIPVVKLMLSLLCSDASASKELIEKARGKYADELNIPISEFEMDYLEEMQEIGMNEVRIYNPDSNEGAWFPKMYAEMKIEENGEERYITVSAPPADKWWNYWITDASVIDFEEKDEKHFEENGEHLDWDEFVPHILEEYNCVRDLIEHRYLKEFLYVIADAVAEFEIDANFNE